VVGPLRRALATLRRSGRRPSAELSAARQVLWRLRTARRSALARNAGKLGIAEILVLLLAIAQSALVARALGPRDFGIAALILSYPALIFTLFDPKASEGVVKYLGQFMATGDRRKALTVPKLAYGVDAGLALLGFAVTAASASLAANHLLDTTAYAQLLVLVAASQMLSAPSDTSRAVLTTFGRFSAVASVQGSAAVVRFVLVVLLVGGGGGIGAFVAAVCLGTLVEALLLGFLAHRVLRESLGASWWAGRWAEVSGSLGEMGRFLLYTDLTSLVTAFVKQADIVILGMITGPTQVGYYRLARSLASPATSVIVALQTALYPQVARLVATSDTAGMMQRIRTWYLLAGIPMAGLSLVVFPVVPSLIKLISGPEFVDAAASARWMLVGSAFVLSCFWLRPIQLATGQVRFMFVNGTILGIISLVAFVVLAGPFQAAGVAAARTVVAGFAGTGVGLWRLRSLNRAGRLISGPRTAVPALV
jgi:O-antigen/teichoic acid export membrane protein